MNSKVKKKQNFSMFYMYLLCAGLDQAQEISEGDAFYALATFVSETGEAMNLVEGERVYVLEWNNADWWYVRKHLTEETGWVPAQYLKDEETYTMYVQRKLVEKIEKLPVFESKNKSQLMNSYNNDLSFFRTKGQ